MIVISSSPVLGPGPDIIDARNPRIGWHNLVRFDNIFSDEEVPEEPSRNLANPATYLVWRGETTNAQQLLVVLPEAASVNYFAIAKHNLGSSGAYIEFQSSPDGVAWTTQVANFALTDDYVMIREFNPVTAAQYRLLITPGVVPPSIGILYVGTILALQRRIYVGHTPLTMGRSTTISTGRSEAGQFLGRVLRREVLESSVNMQHITPDWYRSYFDPFVVSAQVNPFFWAWRPGDYPNESGYAWLTDDPSPSNQMPNGMMQVSFSMQGVR